MFRAEVMDIGADADFPNQTDIGTETFSKLPLINIRLFKNFFVSLVAEVAIYVQAHTDNGPIFSPPWSPAHPIIRAEVAEEQEAGIIVLTLQAHDPLSGLLISNFQLVEEPRKETTTKPPPDSESTLESLFDQIRLTEDGAEIVNETESSQVASSESDINSLIELNKLTGEISFKKQIDYEELINKVN